MNRPNKVIAAIFALTAFALSVVSGMAVGDAAEHVLARAMAAMFVCYLVGMVLGAMITHVLAEHIAKYEKERPIPEVAPAIMEVAPEDESQQSMSSS